MMVRPLTRLAPLAVLPVLALIFFAAWILSSPGGLAGIGLGDGGNGQAISIQEPTKCVP